MKNPANDLGGREPHTLAGVLTGRYGALALTRAAGEAASAERKGDKAMTALWKSVIADLRQTIIGVPERA
jgi:hypothetical protein